MYILKPEMAEELRETKNTIYQKSPESLTDSNYIATIGDICTIKILEEIREPNLCIIDMKTKRNIALNSKQKIQISKIGEKINGNNRSPVEIDQISLLLDNHTSNTKLIHAIQCKESINGRDEAKKVLIMADD